MAAYESSPVQLFDEKATNPASACPPSFLLLAQKNREATHTSTNYCSLKSLNTLNYYINAVK